MRYDKQDQVDKIEAGLLPGESIIAVHDGKGGGTGFIGLTNRCVLQDNGFVGHKVALTSLPYRKINTVSFVSDESMLGKLAAGGSIAIAAGGNTYEIELRGAEKAKLGFIG